MCWGVLLRDAGSLMRCVKPCVTFEGSRTEKQWPRIKAKTVRDQCIHVGMKGFSPRNSKHFHQRSEAVAIASFLLRLTECISE